MHIARPPALLLPGPNMAAPLTGAVLDQGQRGMQASAGEPRVADRSVKDARLMKHPEFPKNRPGLLHAVGLGLTQAALSWHMHEAKTEHEHEKNKKIIIAEATNGALVAALFVTAGDAHAATIDLVTVGNPGNVADTEVMSDLTTGYGSVATVYGIGKYQVTNVLARSSSGLDRVGFV